MMLMPTTPRRVGRTARFTSAGRSLLLLLPSERDAALAALTAARVPLAALRHNPAHVSPISPALSALVSKSTELKAFAQGALVAYMRSVFLQPDKAIFNAAALPLDSFAQSLGLLAAPKLKFLRRAPSGAVLQAVELGGSTAPAPATHQPQPAAAAAAGSSGSSSESEDDEQQQQQQQQQPDTHAPMSDGSDSSSDSDGGLLRLKQRDVFSVAASGSALEGNTTAPVHGGAAAAADGADTAAGLVGAAGDTVGSLKPRKRKRVRINPGTVSGQRVVFDDEGQQRDPLELLAQHGLDSSGSSDDDNSDHHHAGAGAARKHRRQSDGLHIVADAPEARFAAAAAAMVARDRQDKAALSALRRQARLERKIKLRAAANADGTPSAPVVATLGGYASSSGGDDDSSSGDERGGGAGELDAAYLGMARRSAAEPNTAAPAAAAAAAAADKRSRGNGPPQQLRALHKRPQRREPVVEQQDGALGVVTVPKRRPAAAVSGGGTAVAPLADQEAMALALLKAAPW
jgi:ATP-dependent RNA helicase DDX10/DBP4